MREEIEREEEIAGETGERGRETDDERGRKSEREQEREQE